MTNRSNTCMTNHGKMKKPTYPLATTSHSEHEWQQNNVVRMRSVIGTEFGLIPHARHGRSSSIPFNAFDVFFEVPFFF